MKNAAKIAAATGAFIILMTGAAVTFCGLPEARITNLKLVREILTQSTEADLHAAEQALPAGWSGIARLMNRLNPENSSRYHTADADIRVLLEPIRSGIFSFGFVHDLNDPPESEDIRAAFPEEPLNTEAPQTTAPLYAMSAEPDN